MTDVKQIATEMDRQLTDVMPDTWEGHGRIVINEADLSDKQHTFARRLLSRLVAKKEYPAEKAAKAAIAQAQEKVE